MTLLAYIGPGKGFETTTSFQAIVVGIAFALIARCTWWAMRRIGR